MKLAKVAVVVSLLPAAAGCNDKTTFESVPVVGLPCAKTNEALVHPLLLDVKHPRGRLTREYSGGPVTLSLEKDAVSKLAIKLGVCRYKNESATTFVIDCSNVKWVGGEQTLTVDTRLPDAQVVLGAPGEHACKP